MKITRLLATSTVAVLLATTSFAQDKVTAETVVATVNGTDITVGHVIVLTNRLPERFQAAPDADLFEGVINQLIQQTALGQGISGDGKAIKLALENEKRALIASEVLQRVEDEQITEEVIEKAYEDKYADFEGAKEFRASHILVETEEEAEALVTELEGGAEFAALAKDKSTGPSAPAGGDLGWMGMGRTVPAFEAAMIALEEGEVSAPVKTQFGWHVIKLSAKREVAPPALVEVRAELIDTLVRKYVGEHIEKVQADADIQRTELEIDPSVVRNNALLDE